MLSYRVGNVIDELRKMPGDSVQCVVTSPPYFGTRVYSGTQETVWPDGTSCSFGQETTVEVYVDHTVWVLREIKRVLRKDGVVFWDIGDAWAASPCGRFNGGENCFRGRDMSGISRSGDMDKVKASGLKPKDQIMVPFRVALAVQQDGWWVRDTIIWAKKNCMPLSMKDRTTTSHEYIFLFSKSRKYFWDYEAAKEPAGPFHAVGKNSALDHQHTPDPRKKQDALGKNTYTGFNERWKNKPVNGRNPRSVWFMATKGFKMEMCRACKKVYTSKEFKALPDQGEKKVCSCGAVEWLSHFATFPIDLPLKCIKMASRPGDLVLDPFVGSGTTLQAARDLGRSAIGIDISEDYKYLAARRIGVDVKELEG